MREIAFMWIAAIVGALVGYLAGRRRRLDASLDAFDRGADWAEERISVPWQLSEEEAAVIVQAARKVPGAASEPEETDPYRDAHDAEKEFRRLYRTEVAGQEGIRPVLKAMSAWDATRDDEQRQGFVPAHDGHP